MGAIGDNSRPVRGLFFDLGGTLFSYSGRLGGGGLAYLMSEVGISGEAAEVGKAWSAASAAVGKQFHARPYFLHKDLFRATAELFLDSINKTADEEVFENFHAKQLRSLVKHMPLRDECKQALADLKTEGLYLSIVSNIDDDYLDPLVDKHGLGEWLDHWISSEEARSCKPDAGIYQFALERSGLSSDEVLFVGDSLHHDVAGAAKVGMRSVRIVEEGVTTPLTHGLEITAEPDYEIAALTELAGIVASINGSAR